MQLRFTKSLEGMRQAQRYCDDNSALLGGVNGGGGRAAFDAAVARLAGLAELQETHRIQGSGELARQRRQALELRRRHMWPVVRVARSKVPAAAQLEAVRMPPIKSNPTDIVTRARAMATAVDPFRELLHEGGLAPDFVQQLTQATDELERAVSQKRTHHAGRVGATDNIHTEVAEARVQLAALDSLVVAAVKLDEPKLAEWRKIVRDIRRALRSISGSAASDAPAPASETPVLAPASTAEAAGAVKAAA